MPLSVFDLFKVGIGPSSSHTVGPMWAAYRFVQTLHQRGVIAQTQRVRTDLYGSLALTGRGHSTDKAVMLGLSGQRPDTIDPSVVDPLVAEVRQTESLRLAGQRVIPFHEPTDILFHDRESLPRHPNGMRMTAFDTANQSLFGESYYSIGGGFVISDGDADAGHSAATSLQIGRAHV